MMTPLEKAMSAVHANGLNEFDEDDARRFIRAFLGAAAGDEGTRTHVGVAATAAVLAGQSTDAVAQAAILALKETING